MPNKLRDPLFDLVKAVAMFMVVLSHTISYRIGFDFSSMPSRILDFIMVVNMPLFFMISGFFSRRLHAYGDWGKLANRAISYVWPLAFFAMVVSCIDSIVLGQCPFAKIPVNIAKKFLFGGWFFYALAGCEVITFLSWKFGRSLCKQIGFCVLGFLLCLVTSGYIWHTSNIVAMIPFYWFGLTVLPKVVSSNKLIASTAIVGGVAMFFATYCTSGIFTNGLSFYWDRFDVWNPDLIKAANMCSRYIIGILGSLFVFGILKMITRVFPGILSIAFIGKETLGVYFLHGNLIHFVGYRFVDLESNACMLFIAAACIFVAAFGIVVLTKRSNFVDKVVWGVRPHWQF